MSRRAADFPAPGPGRGAASMVITPPWPDLSFAGVCRRPRGIPSTPAALLLSMAFVFSALPAAAHTRSASYSRLEITAPAGAGTSERLARVQLRIPLLELTRHPPTHLWPSYLAARLRLRGRGGPCSPSEPHRRASAPEGWAVFDWTIRCSDGHDLVLESTLMADVLSSHVHFARVVADGRLREAVLAEDAPEWALDATADDPRQGTSFAGWIRLGIEHILEGFDHLAFVVALLLLARSLREVATLVTAFTLAHSLTLGLAVLGYVRPQAAAVEILIGFSIALVAAENGWSLKGFGRAVPGAALCLLGIGLLLSLFGSGVLAPVAWAGLALFTLCHFGWLRASRRPETVRALIAFAFGLIHGFGFAGVLMEIELPAQHLLRALLGFNLGVELGQLAVVAALWPLLRLVQRRFGEIAWRRLAEIGSAVILALGLYWLVSRNWA